MEPTMKEQMILVLANGLEGRYSGTPGKHTLDAARAAVSLLQDKTDTELATLTKKLVQLKFPPPENSRNSRMK